MGVSASAVSRVTGIAVTPKNFNVGNASMLPQRLVIIGQGNDDVAYSLDKYECDGSAASVGARYGFGSPLHLAALQLFPEAGAMATFPVSIMPVKIGDSGFAKAEASIAPAGTATEAAPLVVSVAGLDVQIAVPKGATASEVTASIVAAINAEPNACVVASVVAGVDDAPDSVGLEAKWSGVLGNSISLSVAGNVPGITLTTTSFASGMGVPSINAALAGLGDVVWETFVLDTFNYQNGGVASDLLEVYQVWGEGRWSALEKKPVLVAHGSTDDYATRTAITDARPSDYINFLIESVGSPELPFVVGARGLLDILSTADSNPAQNYKGTLTGLKRGADTIQESYTVRNQSVMKGASTNITNGSVAELNDVVTFYHPAGSGKFPIRRYVVDAVKLANVVYNLRLIFERDEIKGAPLVPDEQVVSNPNAVQPKMFKTDLANLAAALGAAAIISDVKFTTDNLSVGIDSENPKRVNYVFPIKISGNVEIVSGDVYFGQYVGSAV